jgi:ABC-type branched-subunit amino acid transport system substrate-binding protein
MIDGIDWLMKNKGLKPGDTVAHIYLEGDYGEDALLGSTAAAKEYGLTVVPEKVQTSETDMTAQLRRIKAAGVKSILMSTTAGQAASAVSVAETMGLDVTFMGSSPTFDPSLVDRPAPPALTRRFFISQSSSPFSGDQLGPSMFRTKYTTAYPRERATAASGYGYGQGQIMYRILNAACTGRSLERSALVRALHTISNVDTGGLIAPLDYSRPGQPPGRATYIAQPDATVAGGLRVVQPLTAAPLAQTYACPC